MIAFALIIANGRRYCKLVGVPRTPFLGDNYLEMGVKRVFYTEERGTKNGL